MDRVSTGNTRLDTVLGGGLMADAITLVVGAPGSGKTVLAEQFLFANATPRAARPVSVHRLGALRQAAPLRPIAGLFRCRFEDQPEQCPRWLVHRGRGEHRAGWPSHLHSPSAGLPPESPTVGLGEAAPRAVQVGPGPRPRPRRRHAPGRQHRRVWRSHSYHPRWAEPVPLGMLTAGGVAVPGGVTVVEQVEQAPDRRRARHPRAASQPELPFRRCRPPHSPFVSLRLVRQGPGGASNQGYTHPGGEQRRTRSCRR